jgi:hypothetical protein
MISNQNSSNRGGKLIIHPMTSKLSCMKKTSWKTTLYGALAALATWAMDMDDPAWLSTAGKVGLACSVFLLGKNARDRNVSSEDEGAR